MKQVVSLLFYYFSWHRAIRWMVMAGFLLLVIGSAATTLGFELNFRLARVGYLLALVLPYAILAGLFRSLIANQRTSLLPTFHLSAGIALLLMTIMVSAGMQLFGFILASETLPPWMAVFSFIFASAYMAYMQIAITSRHSVLLVTVGSWLIVLCISYFKNNPSSASLLTAEIVVPCLFLTLAMWAFVLRNLAMKNAFRRHQMPWKDKDPFPGLWRSHDKHPDESTPAGTLLLGFPDSFRSSMLGMAMWIIVIPLSCALMFSVIGWVRAGQNLPFFAWTFLTISALLGSCTSLTAGELVARTRLLWLRQGSNRDMQWRALEKLLLRGQACTWLWGFIIVVAMMAINQFGWDILSNYLLFIITISLFFLYFSMLSRIVSLPAPVKGLVYLGTIAAIIWSFSLGFDSQHYFVLNILEGLYLMTAGMLRIISRNKFLGIDWYQVQPVNLARIYKQA